MRFTEREIQLATRMRGAGLFWQPHAGQYVFDIDGLLKAPSPFQAGVHLISSTNAMASLAGGADSLQERFAWLPNWHDARAWLDENDVDPQAAVDALQKAVDNDLTDLEAMYELMLETLDSSAGTEG